MSPSGGYGAKRKAAGGGASLRARRLEERGVASLRTGEDRRERMRQSSAQAVKAGGSPAEYPVAYRHGLWPERLRAGGQHLFPALAGQQADRPIAAEHEALRPEEASGVRHIRAQVGGLPILWVGFRNHARKFAPDLRNARGRFHVPRPAAPNPLGDARLGDVID